MKNQLCFLTVWDRLSPHSSSGRILRKTVQNEYPQRSTVSCNMCNEATKQAMQSDNPTVITIYSNIATSMLMAIKLNIYFCHAATLPRCHAATLPRCHAATLAAIMFNSRALLILQGINMSLPPPPPRLYCKLSIRIIRTTIHAYFVNVMTYL